MKTNFKPKNNPLELTNSRNGELQRKKILLGAVAVGVLLAASQPATAGSIFMILMENHNFVQPNPASSPQQILNNPAAPFMNSLITPGNSNAAQVSFATAYYNDGLNVHPSEPNYVWAEAGSDFGFHNDSDPLAANGNTFYDTVPHLTGQLNAAGVTWKNYQEDVQYSHSPTNSASGNTTNIINPYDGTLQFNYAVKHNPAAFFVDTAVANVFPISQLSVDLNNNAVGQFNWITPDQFNDAHSALNNGFTYKGTHFTGDQAAVAQGDNFLSIVIPQIMATPAYQNNGMIIIWWDETEGGDNTNFTLPEIVISPLAKGNAYASSVVMNHSSDTKTMEEIFGLPALNNPIPSPETAATGGYYRIATVNDLSDLFVPGAIPAPANVTVTRGGYSLDRRTSHYIQQVQFTNAGTTPAPAPLFYVLDNLSINATLFNSAGTTANLPPTGSPYVSVPVGGSSLAPGATTSVTLEFLNPSRGGITYNARVLSVTPAP